MAVERKVLRSISELSMFKYLLIFYLIFFILSVIVMAIIGLIAWRGLFSFGIDNINSILASLGLGNINISDLFGRGMVIGIVISIVGGLVASIFYAAVGTLVVWIMNVVLKISGGIELRFLPGKEEKIIIKE
ncbi:MAG: DUF3566 domain-containing protein [Actinomycetia bacterium]|nr:DUF3566 domain-containing protein [Actinomycetota bacterium]MBU4483080.1 DUF3566 domain-containing protein [Actinomycetota bacterium]MCG2790640.1 DUF3566 domain-containing protein [Actinomycetes bacterium]